VIDWSVKSRGTSTMTNALFFIPAAFFAYEKGNPKSLFPKVLSLMLYGASIAAAVVPWTTDGVLPGVIIAVALAIGLSVGPGTAIGPALHDEKPPMFPAKWQVGIMGKNYWAALLGLGFLRSFLCLIAIPFMGLLPVWIVVASTLSAPLALLAARTYLGGPLKWINRADPRWAAETARSGRMWALQDRLYGAITCLGAVGAGLL